METSFLTATNQIKIDAGIFTGKLLFEEL